MKPQFRITYQAVTEESAEHGDFAHHGFVSRTGNYNPHKNYMPGTPAQFTLRRAVEILRDHAENPIEADCCPVSRDRPPRWFTATHNDWQSGCNVSIGLHLPRTITPASAIRIARLVDCYGVR